MQQKNQNPILWFWDFSHRECTPVSDKLQQCRKSSHRTVPCQNPWDSGSNHGAKWKLSAGAKFIKRPYTQILYSQLNPWLSCDLGKIYIMLTPTSAVCYLYPILCYVYIKTHRFIFYICMHIHYTYVMYMSVIMYWLNVYTVCTYMHRNSKTYT